MSKPSLQERKDYRRNTLLPTFQPLLANKSNNPPEEYYQGLMGYRGQQPSDVNLDLFKFVTEKLNDEPGFNAVKFRGIPKIVDKRVVSNSYNPQKGSIAMYAKNNAPEDPLRTFIHEGVHALDHQDRSDLSTAIPSLAKRERKTGDNFMSNPNWYTQSQQIINNPNFTNGYPFLGPIQNTLQNGLSQIDSNGQLFKNYDLYSFDPDNAKQKGATSFNDLESRLGKNSRPQDKFFRNYSDSQNGTKGVPYFLTPMSEVRSFGIQNLGTEYDINDTNWRDVNEGRKYLKNVLKGTYSDFIKRQPDFATKYPKAESAFIDRLTQLRNYNRYPDPNKYLSTIYNKRDNSYSDATMSDDLPSDRSMEISDSNSSSSSEAGNNPYAPPMFRGNPVKTLNYGGSSLPYYSAPQNQPMTQDPNPYAYTPLQGNQSQGYR